MRMKSYKIILILTLLFFHIIFPTNAITIKQSNSKYQYHTYEEMTDLLKDLETQQPEIMKLESLGKTYEQRDIWLVKISNNVKKDEDKSGVLLIGAHHGNEKPSYEVLIYFIKYIVENYDKNNANISIDKNSLEKRVKKVVNNTQIYIIPMLNPDGVEADTRKNCAPNYGPFGHRDHITSYGVNLNRNYGYKWNYQYFFPLRFHIFNIFDKSFNYRGPKPFSEEETRAVKNLVEKSNISISLSYHTYGEVMLYPWMHTSKPNTNEELFISIGENMSKINKYNLLVHGWRNKSYIIPRLGGTLGTSENWLYAEHEIIAFTMELCNTRAPTDPEIVHDCLLKHIDVNLYVCERSWTIEDEKNSSF